MCNVQALFTGGVTLLAEGGEVAEEFLTSECVPFASLRIN